MTERDGELTCVKGEMGLSKHLRRLLTQYCDDPPLQLSSRQSHANWSGLYYCPLDGAPMITTATLHPMCPMCDRILTNAILYDLLELHPHR